MHGVLLLSSALVAYTKEFKGGEFFEEQGFFDVCVVDIRSIYIWTVLEKR